MGKFGKYWVAYYLVYFFLAVFLVLRHWPALRWDDETYLLLLAAIFGVSAGIAVAVAVFVEVIGAMVLIIPARIKGLIQKGRLQERREWRAWYNRQQAAFREGKPFDEPPPDESPGEESE